MDENRLWEKEAADEIADALLMALYVPVTAVVSLNQDGAVAGIVLFDTAFGAEHMRVKAGCTRVLMLCGHPDGSLELSEEERRNLQALRGKMDPGNVRVFLAGEDIGVIETEA